MKQNIKKATFTLPVDLITYLKTKENQAAFVTEAIKKAKEEEEKKNLKKAVQEMENCKELWCELTDWDSTLEDGIDDPA